MIFSNPAAVYFFCGEPNEEPNISTRGLKESAVGNLDGTHHDRFLPTNACRLCWSTPSPPLQLMRAPSPSTPCLRSKRAPPAETARLLGVTQEEASHVADERYCAAHLVSYPPPAVRGAPLGCSTAGWEDRHYWHGLT